MLSLLDNALLQAATYGIAVLGVALALRVLRYPDLTADGSFMLGSAAFAAALSAGAPWPLAFAAAIAGGALAGAATAAVHTVAHVNRLLSGILTTMICYSLSFRALAGRPNVSLTRYHTPFDAAAALERQEAFVALGVHPYSLVLAVALLAVIAWLVLILLRSEWGLVLRATGSRPSLVERLGRRPAYYLVAGLIGANALVGAAGAVIAARQGFVDVNAGLGLIIVLIAALVLGEQTLRWIWPRLGTHQIAGRIAAAIAGTFLYYLLYLGILRASIAGLIPFTIRPTDLRMFAALLVVGVLLARRRAGASQEDPLSF